MREGREGGACDRDRYAGLDNIHHIGEQQKRLVVLSSVAAGTGVGVSDGCDSGWRKKRKRESGTH